VRLAVFSDDVYRQGRDGIYADLSFPAFVAGLSGQLNGLLLIGRLDHRDGEARHRLPAGVELAPLPAYDRIADPLRLPGVIARSWRSLWRALDDVDAVWILGPHPLALVLLAIALVRRRRVILGVRQDYPSYISGRHPARRSLQLAARSMELVFQAASRRLPVVVVGEDLTQRYSAAPRLLDLRVSLVDEAEIEADVERDYSGELRALSVGRLDGEKNPLMLAGVLGRLTEAGGRWRLIVCGEGPLESALRTELASAGLGERAELHGFVPLDAGLWDLYRSSHALLHVSRTEGVPQVLYEAFAKGLPVVATDVGGVEAAVGEAGIVVPSGDEPRAAAALKRLAEDPDLRARLSPAAIAIARRHTRQAQLRRLAGFLGEAAA
jgi:glycosyltransferase involved in cell wall biosynthesis